MCRRRAHCVERKKGWVFTSDAPAREPMRRSSSLIRSLRMRDLQRLKRYVKSAYEKDMRLRSGGKRTLIFEGYQSVLERVRRRGGC